MVKVIMTGKHEVKRVTDRAGGRGRRPRDARRPRGRGHQRCGPQSGSTGLREDGRRHGRHAAAAGNETACSDVKHSPHLTQLIDALRALPGVGPKTAQRMAFHLLQEGRSGARALASALDVALESVVRCGRCRMLTEEPLCSTCSAPHRDSSLLCVVESPADVVAIEQSGSYRGRYFVLMGHLSPLDGIGPEQLGCPRPGSDSQRRGWCGS